MMSRGFFTELKADPGKLGLETLLSEITKLKSVRAIGLPPDLFTDIAERRIARWRGRCAVVFPSTLRRDHAPAGDADPAGGAVLVPADRGDRLAGGAVHRPGAGDRYPG